MPFVVGQQDQYADSNSVMYPALAAALAEVKQGRNERKIWDSLGPSRITVRDFKYEFLDRSRSTMDGNIGSAGWASAATVSGLPIAAGSMVVLRIGSVIKVGTGEIVVVKALNRGANTIDVHARGAAGTTAAIQASSAAFSVIGVAIRDVDAKNVESLLETTGKYTNYVQTVFETIDQTYSDNATDRYGIAMNQQLLVEALDRVARQCQRACILGQPQAGTSSIPSMTAGLLYQLSTFGSARPALRSNVGAGTFSGNVTNAKTCLKSALTTVWAAGGNPDTIFLHPTRQANLDDAVASSVHLRGDEARVIFDGSTSIFQYNGASLRLVADQDMPLDRIAIVTASQLEKGWKDGDMLRGPIDQTAMSSREKRKAFEGSFYVNVYGVGSDHIDVYGVA